MRAFPLQLLCFIFALCTLSIAEPRNNRTCVTAFLTPGAWGELFQWDPELYRLNPVDGGKRLCGPVCMTRMVRSLHPHTPTAVADEYEILGSLLKHLPQKAGEPIASKGTILEELIEITAKYLQRFGIGIDVQLYGQPWSPDEYLSYDAATAISTRPHRLVPLTVENLLKAADPHTHFLVQYRMRPLEIPNPATLTAEEKRALEAEQVRSFGSTTGKGHYVLLKPPQAHPQGLSAEIHDPEGAGPVVAALEPIENQLGQPTFRLRYTDEEPLTPEFFPISFPQETPLLKVISYIAVFRFYRR